MVGLAIAEANIRPYSGADSITRGSLGRLHLRIILGTMLGARISTETISPGFIEMVWPLTLGYTLAMGFREKEINLRKLLASDRLNKQILLALGMVIMLLALLLSRSRGRDYGCVYRISHFYLAVAFF